MSSLIGHWFNTTSLWFIQNAWIFSRVASSDDILFSCLIHLLSMGQIALSLSQCMKTLHKMDLDILDCLKGRKFYGFFPGKYICQVSNNFVDTSEWSIIPLDTVKENSFSFFVSYHTIKTRLLPASPFQRLVDRSFVISCLKNISMSAPMCTKLQHMNNSCN